MVKGHGRLASVTRGGGDSGLGKGGGTKLSNTAGRPLTSSSVTTKSEGLGRS